MNLDSFSLFSNIFSAIVVSLTYGLWWWVRARLGTSPILASVQLADGPLGHPYGAIFLALQLIPLLVKFFHVDGPLALSVFTAVIAILWGWKMLCDIRKLRNEGYKLSEFFLDPVKPDDKSV